MFQSVVIDNCIISNFGNGVSITPISLAKKINPRIDVDSYPKITRGNRRKDNFLISQLAIGQLKFHDLISN